MGLEKAMIIVDRGKNGEDKFHVLFNPNEYTLSTKAERRWEKTPGSSAEVGQFISGKAASLSMELFFDTSEAQTDVREHTSKVADLVEVDEDLHEPPQCRFVWGSLDFKGVLEDISQKFTMFLDSGIPVRARLSVTFRSSKTPQEQLKETTRQSADRTKQRMLKQGEQLWMLADKEYEDPGRWREIAKANGINNPRKVPTGKHLTVPPLEG